MNTKPISGSRLVRSMLAAALLLGAFCVSQQAVAGIASSKHNLGTGGTGSNHLTTGTAEICVFCHTPHASNTAVQAPLWNKPVSASTTYNMYNTTTSATIDGANPVSNRPGNISLACLSCHDGTQAMDTVINAPGSGGYNASGARMTGTVWAGAGASGIMPTGVAMLGTDLRNDHPVGIQYCGGSSTSSTTLVTSGTCKDADFYGSSTNNSRLQINAGGLGGWVDVPTASGVTGTAGTREKTDMILYNGPNAGTVGAGPQVECASCHDPHSNNATFLRVANNGSTVCLSCHVK